MMDIVKSALNFAGEIKSFLGLVAFVLALLWFVAAIFFFRTPKAARKDTPRLLLNLFWGVFALALTLIVLLFVLVVLEKTGYLKAQSPQVKIFSGPIRLGDNVYARFGGRSLPKIDDPLVQKDTHLVFLDKEKMNLVAPGGVDYAVQLIGASYGPSWADANLEAWKHVAGARDPANHKDAYEGQSIRVDRNTLLVWNEKPLGMEDELYYLPYAVVAYKTSVNLYKALRETGYRPEGRRLAGLTFLIAGLHGGRRFDQPDNIDLVVNNTVYHVPFRSLDTRNEEFIPVLVDSSSVSLHPDETTVIALVVSPFQEKLPVPPPQDGRVRSGPAHFRDVEIGDCYIEFHFESY